MKMPENVGDLKSCPRNPRKISIEAMSGLQMSLTKFGDISGIVWNRNNGQLVCGHQRIEALKILHGDAMKIENGNIVLPNGECMAIRVVEWDETTHSAAMVAANHLGISGEWISEEINKILSDIQSEDIELFEGLCLDDLKIETDDDVNAEKSNDLNDPDVENMDGSELADKWGVKCGQAWIMGEHIIVCGDCTDTEIINMLGIGMNDIGCSIYDPPWDLDIIAKTYNDVLAFTDGTNAKNTVERFGAPSYIFVWDGLSSWYIPNRPLKRCKLCFFYGDIKQYDFNGAHYGINDQPERFILNKRGDYEYKPDQRGKHLSDFFQYPLPKLHTEIKHSYSKPLDWVRLIIGNCTRGDVFDPFAGSGTSIIACEQLGRRCFGIEIDARNVAMILERWHVATGEMPTIKA